MSRYGVTFEVRVYVEVDSQIDLQDLDTEWIHEYWDLDQSLRKKISDIIGAADRSKLIDDMTEGLPDLDLDVIGPIRLHDHKHDVLIDITA